VTQTKREYTCSMIVSLNQVYYLSRVTNFAIREHKYLTVVARNHLRIEYIPQWLEDLCASHVARDGCNEAQRVKCVI
jgi:hypothetical protein